MAGTAKKIRQEFSFAREQEEQEIVEQIHAAVMEQRLPPSTKLSESKLCEAFGVGRMRVRRALLLLASQGIVDLPTNRGAFVACPDRKEADDVFGARLALEPGIVRDIAKHATRQDVEELQRHFELEQQARQKRQRRDSIRLSGEFHVKLVSVAGNLVLTRMIQELVTRTSLIIGLFGSSGMSNCDAVEHLEILAAIGDRDHRKAERLVRTHLECIKSDLDLDRPAQQEPDIAEILRQR
ncbi:MAG: GntR family transcriptional regulator [Hyphomicrobiaceae bacterium]